METNITKGNWEVIIEKSGQYSNKTMVGLKNYYPEYSSGGSNLILFTAKKSTVPALNNQIEANAKLIAAAPEMLKALQQYEKQFEQLFTVPLGKNNEESLKIWFTFASKDAKNAIKKATGQ